MLTNLEAMKVYLAGVFTDVVADGGTKPDDVISALADSIEKLRRRNYGLLVILQGIDASGKDGVIEELRSIPSLSMHLRVAHFRQPTQDEARHDFLWRSHKAAPGRGEVVIFNRSYYEDVIVPHVQNNGAFEITGVRYQHICAFERLLYDERIVVVKCLLYVTRETQRRRLASRVARAGLLHNHHECKRAEQWDAYIAAYESMMHATSAEYAPWYVIPADDRVVRNRCVAQAVMVGSR